MGENKVIESIQKLIDDINVLSNQDINKLTHVIRRIMMTIRITSFKELSKKEYREDLKTIVKNFFSVSSVSSSLERKGNYDEVWSFGKKEMLSLLNTMKEELELQISLDIPPESKKVQKSDIKSSNRIFIVHGHDEAMKQTVARVVGKIGLEAIILHEQANEGRTIIEKLIDHSDDVSFAIVLLSPDDIAYSKDQSSKDAKSRARQNVIFELGFFISKFGRNRVLVLYQEEDNFEMPSDYSGILYTIYDKSNKWPFELVRELRNCGYDVDSNKLI